MSSPALPSLFLSHGSPMILIEDGPARQFLTELGRSLPHPEAILVASAHWEEPTPRLAAARRPATIHDFGGFPPELYRISYRAAGAPAMAERALALLRRAGLPAAIDEARGLDHGVWVPLSLMYPDASCPVVALSLLAGQGPLAHLRLGEAVAPLREQGVLIVGSGSLTHSLDDIQRGAPDSPAADWVASFQDWMFDAISRGDREALLEYRRLAPAAARNHPTEEHLMPLFVALGAAGPEANAARLHASVTYGALAMDTYAFG
jgi:4,5-DOPA dioxygenase extradiol